ncbi:MAG: S8 family serine peptidase [Candidatus Cloacimonetes bacterium]|nr:S8 family serine peptidase [Candidatus Cloacimonadota bacterium]
MRKLIFFVFVFTLVLLQGAELPKPLELLSRSPQTRELQSDFITVRHSASGDVVTEVILHGQPSIAQINAIGGTVGSSRNGITTLTIPVRLLSSLKTLDGVEAIYPSYNDIPLLANSTSNEIISGDYRGCNSDAVQALNIDGSGVLIGVIDTTNLNWQHEDFYTTSIADLRVAALWDQTDTSTSHTPAGFTYGREYTQSDLQGGTGPVINSENHGTPCSGVVAGDGSASSGSKIGMAPGAEIIYVQTSGTSARFIDAINYIENVATTLGLPVVISVSLGITYGATDGSHSTALALDGFCGAGKMAAIACGNWFTEPWFSAGTVTYGSPINDLSFTITGSDTGNLDYVISRYYYKLGDEIDVSVTSPSGTTYGPVYHPNDAAYNTPDGRCYLEHNSTGFGNPYILIVISDEAGTITSGDTWTVHLSCANAAADDEGGRWWAQIAGTGFNGTFDNYVNGEGSLNVYASSQKAFSVAAHQTYTPYCQLYSSCSAGAPDGYDKPDICSPTNASTPSDAGTDTYMHLCCTSGAAPHAAGAVALIYQRYPDATVDEVRSYIFDNAWWDTVTQSYGNDGRDYNYRVGFGKLNAYGAYTAAAYETEEQIAGSGNYSFSNPTETGAPVVAEINFTSENIDAVTLTKHVDEAPGDMPPGGKAVAGWFDIESSGGSGAFNCSLTLYYTDAELNAAGFTNVSASEARLQLYRWSGSEWVVQGGTVDTGANKVTLAGVSNFSQWAIGDPDDGTLPVTLTTFAANYQASGFVSLEWTVASETSMLGYNILRHTQPSAEDALTLTPSPIDAVNSSHEHTYLHNDYEVTSNTTYYYWIEAIELGGETQFHGPVSVTTIVEEEDVPGFTAKTSLAQNIPNPFNPVTTLSYSIKGSEGDFVDMSLLIYNIKGQQVRSLHEGAHPTGVYSLTWSGKNEQGKSVSSGVYFARLSTPGKIVIRKMMMLK